MKKNIYLLLLLSFFNIYSSESDSENSEFTVKRKSSNKSIYKIRESIAGNARSILKINLKIDQHSLDLRKFLLQEIESYLVEDKNSFLLSANLNQLQEALDELKSLKKILEKNFIDFENKIIKLKNKFDNPTE